jgi:Flp pilus assembly protein TadD
VPRRSLLVALALSLVAAACGRDRSAPAGPSAGSAAPRASAAPSPAEERPRTVGELEARATERPPVIFVGLDGADWRFLEPLLASGAMPELARLRAESAWGVLKSEVPTLSPLLWTSMMTGVSPLEHGVLDFSRFQPGSGVREPITRDERRVPAVWNAATWAGKSAAVFGLWATHPAEAVDGVVISDRFFGFLNLGDDRPPAGFVHPRAREDWALETLRRVDAAVGREALAEYLPDLSAAEYEQRAASERPYEHPVSALRRILVETRAYDELARSWLAEKVPDLTVVYFQGTDSIGHTFAPYAPPRQPSVEAADFERYERVPERYFREVDALLGRYRALAERAGAVLVLASDHGFLWGEGRPDRLSSFANATAARWHDPQGIWLVRGGGARAGRGAEGSLRQVFPTLLALVGLPAAGGAEARPLAGLAPPAAPEFDYARVFRELRAAAAPAATAPAPGDAAAEEIAKLQALGYIGAGEATRAPEAARAAGSTRTAGSFNNEGILLRGERRDDEARRAFEQALALEPNLASAAWNLSDLLHAARELDRADALLVTALANGLPEGVRYVVGRAIGYQRGGELARSVKLLEGAAAARPGEKELWLFLGRYRVESRDCRGASADFARAAAIAPGDPAVHASAAMAHLCAGERAAAAAAFRRSLELAPDQPKVRELLAQVERGG